MSDGSRTRDTKIKRIGFMGGYFCSASADGTIPLNSVVLEPDAVLAVVNTAIQERDAAVERERPLREALEFSLKSIEEAVRLSAVYNGHEYNFKPVVEQAKAALERK